MCKRKHPVTPAKTLCAYFRSKLSTLGIEKVGPIEEGAAAAAQLSFASVRALVVVVVTSRTRSDRMTILPYYVLVMLPLQSKRKIQKPYFLSKRSRPSRQYWAGRLRAGRTMPQTGVLWHCWYCTAQPTLSKFLSDNFLGRRRSCRTKTE